MIIGNIYFLSNWLCIDILNIPHLDEVNRLMLGLRLSHKWILNLKKASRETPFYTQRRGICILFPEGKKVYPKNKVIKKACQSESDRLFVELEGNELSFQYSYFQCFTNILIRKLTELLTSITLLFFCTSKVLCI